MRLKDPENIRWTDKLRFYLHYSLGRAYLFFSNLMARDWRDYDPTWLIDLAKEQHPDKPDIHKALTDCTRAYGDIPYIHFIDSKRANKPGSEWQIGTGFSLVHPVHGDIIVDRMKDGRIGGVEFLGELLKEE